MTGFIQKFEEENVAKGKKYFTYYKKQWNEHEEAFKGQQIKLESQNTKLEAENTKLRSKLHKQEEVIRQIQEATFRMGEQAGWTPEPDAVLGDELKRLETLVRDFSKNFAISNVGLCPVLPRVNTRLV